MLDFDNINTFNKSSKL